MSNIAVFYGVIILNANTTSYHKSAPIWILKEQQKQEFIYRGMRMFTKSL